jgi:hypothetical protein
LQRKAFPNRWENLKFTTLTPMTKYAVFSNKMIIMNQEIKKKKLHSTSRNYVLSEVYIPPLFPDELLQLTYDRFEITKSYMWLKGKAITVRTGKEIKKLIHKINKSFKYNKEFSLDNPTIMG